MNDCGCQAVLHCGLVWFRCSGSLMKNQELSILGDIVVHVAPGCMEHDWCRTAMLQGLAVMLMIPTTVSIRKLTKWSSLGVRVGDVGGLLFIFCLSAQLQWNVLLNNAAMLLYNQILVSMKQIAFLWCFPTENGVLDLKHLSDKMTAAALSTHVRVAVNHKLPHNCKDQNS